MNSLGQTRARLVLVVDIGGEIALDAIKEDLVRRLDAHPLYRVIAATWQKDFRDESQHQEDVTGVNRPTR